MSNRYSNTFSLKKSYYCNGSPVILHGGAIHYDNLKEVSIARLKFKNISEKVIKSISVIFEVSDEKSRQKKHVKFLYKDISLNPGESFGEKIAIDLPINNANCLSIVKLGAVSCGEEEMEQFAEWKPVAQKTIASILPSKFQQIAYAKRFGKNAKRAILENDKFWVCTCGNPCAYYEGFCEKCYASRLELNNLNTEELLEQGVLMYARKKAESKSLTELKKAKDALSHIENSEEAKEISLKISNTIKKKKAKRTKIALTSIAVIVSLCVSIFLIFALMTTKYTFNTNGGSKINPIMSSEAITLPTPTREGYIFDGWYENENLKSGRVTSPYKADGNITLYAKWKEAGENFDSAIEIKKGSHTFTAITSYTYFEFVPTVSGYYTFKCTSTADVDATLYGSNKISLQTDNSYGNFKISYSLQSGQTYYLAVKSSANNRSCTIIIE